MDAEDEIRRLRRIIEESDARIQIETRRREEAEKRQEESDKRREEAEKRREESDRRREEADERREEVEERIRPTTFEEFLRLCHEHIYLRLKVERVRKRSTQGTAVSRRESPCPKFLKPWNGFSGQQQLKFEEILKGLGDARDFRSIQYLEELGGELAAPLGSEKDLETYHRLAVERPTTNIVKRICDDDELRETLGVHGEIFFANHVNVLADDAEEVLQALAHFELTDNSPLPTHADQICVYQTADGRRELKLVAEYKPPHKLPALQLRAGLHRANGGSLDLPISVFSNARIPTSPTESFRYHAERLVGAVLAQLYSYMLESGLPYGVLTTGDSYVFAHIKEDEPHTLYYHFTQPRCEVDDDEWGFILCRTSIGQFVPFCLNALQSTARDQEWRIRAIETSPTTTLDEEEALKQMTPIANTHTPAISTYSPSPFPSPRYPPHRSPYMLRRKKRPQSGCSQEEDQPRHDKTPSDSDSDDGSDKPMDSPTPAPQNRARQPQNAPARETRAEALKRTREQHRQRAYCSQACLLGLVSGRKLDNSCPNAAEHPTTGKYHSLRPEEFQQKMEVQLHNDLDFWCDPLNKGGARGVLFKVTLASHGYTVVAKGTVTAFVPYLQHEEKVYEQVAQLQGRAVPVCLGSIRLTRPYYLVVGVRIVHMLLLSWAGEEAEDEEFRQPTGELLPEVEKLNTQLMRYGVCQNDLRTENVLRNPITQQLMIIDFERAKLVEPTLSAPERLGSLVWSMLAAVFSSESSVLTRWWQAVRSMDWSRLAQITHRGSSSS